MSKTSSEQAIGDFGYGLPGVADLVVVEIGEGLAAPLCAMLLAELGARVIKIEPFGGDWCRQTGPPFVDDESPAFLAVNRGKESVALDLKTDGGPEALAAIVSHADVVLEGYRPGVFERYGIGPALTERYPRLVYCGISGYGDRGPKTSDPGTDSIAQGYAGLMNATGYPDGPPARAGTQVADVSCGVNAAFAVLALLLRRERTGRGGVVSTSLVESLIHLQSINFAMFAAGDATSRIGTRSSLAAVPAEGVATADGYLLLSCHSARQWEKLCNMLAKPEWLTDPVMRSNADRVANHDEVMARLGAILRTRSSNEWLDDFRAAGINAGPVLTYEEVLAEPQIQALNQIRKGQTADGEFTYVTPGFSVDGFEWRQDAQAPRIGENTASVLAEFGIDVGGRSVAR